MKVELIGYDGRGYAMPTVLRWRLLRTGQVPCDDLEVTCVYDGTLLGVMPEISRFRATENGVTALSGVVDEYAAAATEEGLLLTVSGRGMAALLLDNEAEAATYQDTTTAEILRNHAAPYGIVCRRARELVRGNRERPDIYISSLGSSPAATSTGKVLVSFTPNSSPRSRHRAWSRRNMGMASAHWRSSRKWWSSKAM